jgi:hypothetical protein
MVMVTDEEETNSSLGLKLFVGRTLAYFAPHGEYLFWSPRNPRDFRRFAIMRKLIF